MLKDLRKNPIMLSDVYNLSHERLKVNNDWEVSHMYNRSKPMVLFGLLETINSVLSIKITEEMVNEAEFHGNRMGVKFPKELWMRVVNECNGYLPLKIQSLQEGTYVPTGTPFMQVRNTVEGMSELVSWLEPIFLHSYYPATCATQAFRMYKYLEQKKRQHGYDESFMIRFHSFGFRGSRSLEDAYWQGVAWNLFMKGTDDFHTAIHTPTAEIGSIPAQGHKVIMQFDDEFEGFKHSIKAVHVSGEKMVALVIDTYNPDVVINEYLLPLAIYADSLGVHIVLRPDSGNTWEQVVNAYKIVSRNKLTNVTAIIGEGMDFENAKKCDEYMEQHNVPLNFVAYGIGSGFYNYITRDTLNFAYKTAYSNGKPRMKFSAIPLKRSIPNIVTLNYNEFGDMVVDFEQYNGQDSLYQDIYFHDQFMKEPIIKVADVAHWESVRELALTQNTDQNVIYKSKAVQEMTNTFFNTYKG